jgi:hypothetical protein
MDLHISELATTELGIEASRQQSSNIDPEIWNPGQVA